jgi:hypothetical protein
VVLCRIERLQQHTKEGGGFALEADSYAVEGDAQYEPIHGGDKPPVVGAPGDGIGQVLPQDTEDHSDDINHGALQNMPLHGKHGGKLSQPPYVYSLLLNRQAAVGHEI